MIPQRPYDPPLPPPINKLPPWVEQQIRRNTAAAAADIQFRPYPLNSVVENGEYITPPQLLSTYSQQVQREIELHNDRFNQILQQTNRKRDKRRRKKVAASSSSSHNLRPRNNIFNNKNIKIIM